MNTSKQHLYFLCSCALMTALLCVLAPLSVPIGPVPVSLAILAVCLNAYILGMKGALISVLVYLLLGAAGVPVFAGFTGGLAKLAGPTGGYLAGYLLTAAIGGRAAEKSGRRLLPTAFGLAVGVLAAYFAGTLWFLHVTGSELGYALSVCVFPFIPFDIAKIAVSVLIGATVRSALRRAGLLEEVFEGTRR